MQICIIVVVLVTENSSLDVCFLLDLGIVGLRLARLRHAGRRAVTPRRKAVVGEFEILREENTQKQTTINILI